MVAKIDVNKVELVWPGKYNEDGTLKEVPRVHLPFQVIETVNESRATREAAKKPENLSLFDVYEGKEGDTFEEGWRNKLIWGDNLLVMGSLLEKFAGKIDLIYIDPPFATGADFSFKTPIGEFGGKVLKDQSIIEEKAYRDTWGKGLGSYVPMMWERLGVMKDLLSSQGTIAVHVDWRVGYLIKAMLDELFGIDALINEIIWYYTGAGASPERFSRRHDNIYWYANGSAWFFDPDPLRTDYAEATKERFSHHIGNVRGGHDFGVQFLVTSQRCRVGCGSAPGPVYLRFRTKRYKQEEPGAQQIIHGISRVSIREGVLVRRAGGEGEGTVRDGRDGGSCGAVVVVV